MKKHRIAILLHEKDNELTLSRSLVKDYSRYWQEDGHEVIYIFGTKQFIPADILLVHVDLTIVPDEYLEFAKQYPVALNAGIKDIRKSVVCDLNLEKNDIWSGPVIVKSDFNCAGIPERRRFQAPWWMRKRAMGFLNSLSLKTLKIPKTSDDYQVYDNLAQVPAMLFRRPDLVVQKFLPEMDNGLYCVRTMIFIGNRIIGSRLKSRQPVVKGDATFEIEHGIEVHPDMLQLQHEMGFDYGKFDYVEIDGKALLLDANKTIGISSKLENDPAIIQSRRYRAEGLYSFFSD